MRYLIGTQTRLACAGSVGGDERVAHMRYQVRADDDRVLDARFQIQGADIVYLARYGNKRGSGGKNSDYGEGLRILLRRLKTRSIRIREVTVDSSQARKLPNNERVILSAAEAEDDVDQLFTRLSGRMRELGRGPSARGSGNATKRIRISTFATVTEAEFAELLGGVKAEGRGRLPASKLRRVGPQHVWYAVQRMLDGARDEAYGEPSGYEVVLPSGERLAPKEVFGLAASDALGFRVRPEDFSGGDASIAVEVLRASGYEVVPKGTEPHQPHNAFPVDPEELNWAEGSTRLVTHLHRERNRPLVQAKKAQFRAMHGELYCEECGLRPDETYGGQLGEACIEAHHLTPVSQMAEGHVTHLDELQLLCANCHRVEHRRLKLQEQAESA